MFCLLPLYVRKETPFQTYKTYLLQTVCSSNTAVSPPKKHFNFLENTKQNTLFCFFLNKNAILTKSDVR